MKKNAGFLIALALLAVVGGAVAYLMMEDEKTPTAAPPSETRLFKDDLAKLSALSIERGGEEAIRLVSKDGSAWSIEAPQPLAVDGMAVGEMLGNLRTLDAERVLDEPGPDRSAYGIESPFLAISLTEGDSTRRLSFGAMNPMGSARYASLSGSQKLYLIPSASVNALNKSLADLRRKRAFEWSDRDLSRIVIRTPTETRELVRNQNQNWTFASPEGFSADQTLMNSLVSSVTGTQTDAAAIAGEPFTAGRFSALPLVAAITVEGSKGTETAEFRRTAEGTVYMESNAVGGIYPVRADFETYLAKPLEEFRNLRLFSFGFADILKLRYEAGERRFTLSKPNDNWDADGKTVDPANANRLVDELRSATASAFLNGDAPGAVTHSLEVETGGGSKERVEIRKAENASFAVRIGEKGYYKLPENLVNDIDKAAEAIKP